MSRCLVLMGSETRYATLLLVYYYTNIAAELALSQLQCRKGKLGIAQILSVISGGSNQGDFSFCEGG